MWGGNRRPGSYNGAPVATDVRWRLTPLSVALLWCAPWATRTLPARPVDGCRFSPG
jgi:hypothetical protein